jgi:hypothetical protein
MEYLKSADSVLSKLSSCAAEQEGTTRKLTFTQFGVAILTCRIYQTLRFCCHCKLLITSLVGLLKRFPYFLSLALGLWVFAGD